MIQWLSVIPFQSDYNGIGVDATVTPSATQKIIVLSGTRTFTTFAGKDSIDVIYGTYSNTTLRGCVLSPFTGAAFGNPVSVSPDMALPAGYFIAWARVSAATR
jgi:hypothetical protein